MKLKNYDHIIWDWNGTLFDDSSLTLSIMNGMLSSRGLPEVSPEKYAELFNFPVQDYYKKIGWNFKEVDFKKLSDEFIEEYYRRHKECPLRDGARDILKMNSVPQSILTASKQTDIDLLLKHFELSELFIGVKGLDNHHAAGKLEVGKKWVASLNVSPKRILVVGDTTHDAELAAELGLNCVLITSGHQSKVRLIACKVTVINNLRELI